MPSKIATKSVRYRLGLALIACAALASAPASADPTEEGDPLTSQLDPDFAAGKAAIEAKEWKAAIVRLSSAALRDTRNADIQNYLGYAHRQLGEMDAAFRHYERSLKLDPRHRGAHEYVGEAWLKVGNLQKAEEHLAALRKICLIPCEETDDLQQAITRYRLAKKQ